MLNDPIPDLTTPLAIRNQRLVERIHEICREQAREYTDAELAAMDPLESLRACMAEALRDAFRRSGQLEAAGLHGNDEDRRIRFFIWRWETALRRASPERPVI